MKWYASFFRFRFPLLQWKSCCGPITRSCDLSPCVFDPRKWKSFQCGIQWQWLNWRWKEVPATEGPSKQNFPTIKRMKMQLWPPQCCQPQKRKESASASSWLVEWRLASFNLAYICLHKSRLSKADWHILNFSLITTERDCWRKEPALCTSGWSTWEHHTGWNTTVYWCIVHNGNGRDTRVKIPLLRLCYTVLAGVVSLNCIKNYAGRSCSKNTDIINFRKRGRFLFSFPNMFENNGKQSFDIVMATHDDTCAENLQQYLQFQSVCICWDF